ncbi:Asp23/Gls24 family envelope stress response protein [Acetilactobacillus jinshanensis]|uniref:Asp23/Gls24 family envelope stress response protein n=1 Tax=Acetilactobacillus jinshanensis TaxID=1720083 RepID=A0A4P6ZN33_9LACO|nr:Asp23/Gls24 family envelope stress response protein [Acetilactobacillus jinshanensis]QBP18620.1 Asp23/Gls24 family envelope stress response protein [Acetilactobacillus jinshanensis]URL61496.1 Asp23/Gls24 family envelope stress response protein [uncultured bacterium]
MTVKMKDSYGTIDLNKKVIATVVGGAATDNYGVVGMASQNQLRDNVNVILRRDDYSRGIEVHQDKDGISIDINIIVSYGTKISEVSKNVQAKAKYNLKEMLGLTPKAINVIVQGVQVNE